MILHNNIQIFSEVIVNTSAEIGLTEYQVEKDYYVSLLLKHISLIESLIIVFKGGTSLSKCFKVIDRFSEDIDLAVQFKTVHMRNSEKRNLKLSLLKVIHTLGFELLNEENIRSKRVFNRYEIRYPKIHNVELPTIPNIILETMVVFEPYPWKMVMVNNYVSDYLLVKNMKIFIEQYDLRPFMMAVQSIERTFIDKLYAICDYHLKGEYNRYSRHIYDIHMIWVSGLLDFIVLDSLIERVTKDRQLYGVNTLSCQMLKEPNKILSEIIRDEVYKNDYINTTQFMTYKQVSYDTCIISILSIIDKKILPFVVQDFSCLQS